MIATTVLAYLGVGLFGLPPWVSLTLCPLAGVVAGLACSDWRIAGLGGGLGVLLGTYAGSFTLAEVSGRVLGPYSYWVPAALAVVVAGGVASLLDQMPHVCRYVEWVGVGLVVLSVILCGWADASLPAGENNLPSSFALYDAVPAITANISDTDVYITAIRRMQRGEDYYHAMGHTYEAVDNARPAQAWNLQDPAQYKMPTLFWFLSALPSGGRGWVAAMLVLASVATVAGWTIASRYVSPPIALVGATILGAYLEGFGTANLPQSELWSGLVLLIGLALALKSLSVRERPMAWAVAAACAGLLAALLRDVAGAFMVVGLASTLVTEGWRSRRLWVPWVVAALLFVLAYAAHISAAIAVGRTLPHVVTLSTGGFLAQHFDPSGRGLLASVVEVSQWAQWSTAMGWVIVVSGAVGAVLAPRDGSRRALVAGIGLGGVVALVFFHPAGKLWGGGLPPSYWGQLVMPSVIACATLPLSRVAWTARRRGRSLVATS